MTWQCGQRRGKPLGAYETPPSCRRPRHLAVPAALVPWTAQRNALATARVMRTRAHDPHGIRARKRLWVALKCIYIPQYIRFAHSSCPVSPEKSQAQRAVHHFATCPPLYGRVIPYNQLGKASTRRPRRPSTSISELTFDICSVAARSVCVLADCGALRCIGGHRTVRLANALLVTRHQRGSIPGRQDSTTTERGRSGPRPGVVGFCLRPGIQRHALISLPSRAFTTSCYGQRRPQSVHCRYVRFAKPVIRYVTSTMNTMLLRATRHLRCE